MLKTYSTLRQQVKKHSQSLNNFVLLNKQREIQEKYQWNPLKTRQRMIERTQSMNRKISFGGSYDFKKSLLRSLSKKEQYQTIKSQKQKSNLDAFVKSKIDWNYKSNQQLNGQHKINRVKRSNNESINRIKMQTKLSKFTYSSNNFYESFSNNNEASYLGKKRNEISTAQKTDRSDNSLEERVYQASLKNERVIGVFTIKRYGLRMRVNHSFVEVCLCQNRNHKDRFHKFSNNQKIDNLSRQMLSISPQSKSNQKNVYYFRLSKQSIQSSNELSLSQYCIIVSLSPVLNTINSQFHITLIQQAEKLKNVIQQLQAKLGINFQLNQKINLASRKNHKSPLTYKDKNHINVFQQDQKSHSTQYDWQNIECIQDHVDKMCQNPQYQNSKYKLTSSQNKSNQISVNRQMRNWCNQKFKSQSNQQFNQQTRNPLLQDHNHYPQELKNKKMMHTISQKLQQQNIIKNCHILKRQPIEVLIEKKKQQNQQQENEKAHPNILKRNIDNVLSTHKGRLRQLDSKNTLLFQQNIPYMMEKYGINRYEIHNLYTLYKTLQKISALRVKSKKQIKKVISKGIDRQTFDQGMKRLDINPGQQVIKNICYFDDFIAWQQFIKIVSIGLRKTLQEKLEAILSGIGGANQGHLTRSQISIMIGSSLNKIFDSEQIQLKQYFTEVAMKDLDKDENGIIEVSQIKRKVLQADKVKSKTSQSSDLVTFLLLNS